jgi:hypothetical protein
MPSRAALYGLAGILAAIWCVGMFARAYWTPDEPREADIAWRMSWQDDKAVPLLLIGPDETTRAMIDMFARTEVNVVEQPITAISIAAAQEMARQSNALALTQLPGRTPPANPALAQRFHSHVSADPPWLAGSKFSVLHRYELPNGRRYALLEAAAD